MLQYIRKNVVNRICFLSLALLFVIFYITLQVLQQRGASIGPTVSGEIVLGTERTCQNCAKVVGGNDKVHCHAKLNDLFRNYDADRHQALTLIYPPLQQKKNMTDHDIEIKALIESKLIINTTRQGRPTTLDKRYFGFSQAVSFEEKQLMYNLLGTLQSVCDTLHIPCFMVSGTLLGSWRHHDLIPWDDDADFMTALTHKQKLLLALSELHQHRWHDTQKGFIKFYASNTGRQTHKPWRWPFVDIFFHYNCGSCLCANNIDNFKFDESWIFPLHRRPFGPLFLDAPNFSVGILQATLGSIDNCIESKYSHKYENRYKSNRMVLPYYMLLRLTATPCVSLSDFMPFVSRNYTSSGTIIENLMLKKEILRSVVYKKRYTQDRTIDDNTHSFS